MLKNYRIVDEDSHKGAGAIIPGFGLVPLDADVLTDDMAKAAVAEGSPFFEEVGTHNPLEKGAKAASLAIAESEKNVKSQNA